MRACLVLLSAIGVVGTAGVASAQAQPFRPSFSIQAAGGPTAVNSGHTISAAVGFSPWSRVTFLLDAQRTETSPRIANNNGSPYTDLRGGTMEALSGEVRVTFWPVNRVTPYVLAGFGGGNTRPTVNEVFPDPVTNKVAFIIFGAGVHVPVGNRFSVFGDFRVLGGPEGYDSMIVMYPVRFGMGWRF